MIMEVPPVGQPATRDHDGGSRTDAVLMGRTLLARVAWQERDLARLMIMTLMSLGRHQTHDHERWCVERAERSSRWQPEANGAMPRRARCWWAARSGFGRAAAGTRRSCTRSWLNHRCHAGGATRIR